MMVRRRRMVTRKIMVKVGAIKVILRRRVRVGKVAVEIMVAKVMTRMIEVVMRRGKEMAGMVEAVG